MHETSGFSYQFLGGFRSGSLQVVAQCLLMSSDWDAAEGERRVQYTAMSLTRKRRTLG